MKSKRPLSVMFLHHRISSGLGKAKIAEEKELVRKLSITGLCLFTDAGYTRHLSQVDLHSAFQDYPVFREHFLPSSYMRPPDELWLFE